jgi:hypothetical protein
MRRVVFAVLLVLFLASPIFAQGGNAALTGFIQDSTKAFVPNVRVLAINTETNQQFEATSNKEGSYNIASLPVGPYRIQIEKIGFQTILKEGLFLHTQDVLQINFKMALGSTSETVTVSGEGNNINTTDATVGTVIDRQFVQAIPLNGRSFQDLILLSPGVTSGSESDSSGGFSVNGGRTTGNNFTLDGVSAMNSAGGASSGPSSTGSTFSTTSLGTTHAIISIDALQEFRIATATYSAEFGRYPGAQISITSRSGTNQYHGTVFDYLRNYAFDANDWFNTYSSPEVARPQERQNDFGGVIGGPISIPKLFSGRDHAFWFFSYEGLRLQKPYNSTVDYVPSNGTFNTATYADPKWKNLRANAPTVIQPLLNGFPLPNCSTARNPQCVDYGDGLSPFIFSMTQPATVDAIFGRVDFQPLSWLHVFARYNDSESSAGGLYDSLSPNTTSARVRAYLLGVDGLIRGSVSNELRVQYAPAYQITQTTGQTIGGETSVTGSQTPNIWSLAGLPNGGKGAFMMENFPGNDEDAYLGAESFGSRLFQYNIVDTVHWTQGKHNFATGVDYRQTVSYLGDGYLSYGPVFYYRYYTPAKLLSNTTSSGTSSNVARQDPLSKNFGTFFQDQWRVQPRLTLSLGLRWDLDPPTSISGGGQQYTYTGSISNPASLALSALGAPFYKTTYTDFAPRVGVAYVINNQPGHELVLRTGGGLFFDTGQSAITNTVAAGESLGATGSLTFTGKGFPQSPALILAPISTTIKPPYDFEYAIDPNFVPPSTIGWSFSLEQALGAAQSVSVGYVGSTGRNLAQLVEHSGLGTFNPLFKNIRQYQNGPGSSYNSLQVQYKRQMTHGLQVLASYTWAHAIDSDSADYGNVTDGLLPPQRGNSDHDIRHNFAAALVYHLPMQYADRWKRTLLGNWDLDLHLVDRTAFPVQPTGPLLADITGLEYPQRLNYNGKNTYVRVAKIPGGRQFDPTVFSLPPTTAAGTAPRNFLRGFGDNSVDTAIQRIFVLYEQVNLQFRAEAFNVFNHPNFGSLDITCGTTTPGATCSNPLFGQSTATISSGTGQSAIYKQGGPRSLQLALKLQF